MIGLETMQTVQLVFFVRYILGNNGPMAVYSMYPLAYINGYNPFAAYSNVYQLDSVTMRMNFTKTFFFNSAAQIVLVIVSIILYFIFKNKVDKMKLMKIEMTPSGL